MKKSARYIYGSIAVALSIAMMFFVWRQTTWRVPVVYLVVINGVTFLFYLWDKIIAPTKMTRVPEIVLHALAVFGGSPVAFLAQKLFRHKIQKTKFQIIFWLIALAQIVAIGYWLYVL